MSHSLPEFFLQPLLSENRLALATAHERYTYGDLFQEVRRLSNQFKEAGLPEGAVVGLYGSPGLGWMAAFLALAQRQAVIVPVERAEEKQLQARLLASKANWLITLDTRSDLTIDKLVEETSQHPTFAPLSGMPGLVLFSSGSVGQPKAILHALPRLLDGYGGQKPKQRNWLLLLLLDHIGGLHTWFSCMAQQGCLVIPEERSPEAVAKAIEQHQVALLPATPSFLALMLSQEVHHRYQLSSLKLITFGTEPMSSALYSSVKAAFPGVRFLQTFGTSETGILKTDFSRDGSLALNFREAEGSWRIVNGELQLRSTRLSLGYMGHDNSRFLEDGWYKTGDLAEVDALGQVRILGRQASVINVGGLKLIPAEVEEVLLHYPGLNYCKVEGESHALTGQVVVATVGFEHLPPPENWKNELRKFCSNQLERYKVPVKWRLIDAIPTITNRLKAAK